MPMTGTGDSLWLAGTKRQEMHGACILTREKWGLSLSSVFVVVLWGVLSAKNGVQLLKLDKYQEKCVHVTVSVCSYLSLSFLLPFK